MNPLVTFNKRRISPSHPPVGSPRPLKGDLRNVRRSSAREGPRVLFSRDGRGMPFHNAWKGQHCFLICGGPSLKSLDLTLLSGRGMATMALNNAWLMHRPTFWVSADPPDRFSDLGWRDPSILKFVPFVHAKSKLASMNEGGVKVKNEETPGDMPSTFYFVRNDGFDPKTFLDEDGISWGTLKKTKDSLGIANSRSVMLCAMKLLPWMGFTSIYLLGCDFHMPLGHGPAYAWDEDKTKKGRIGNNNLYQMLTSRLTALKPFLDGRGISVWNCNLQSALKVFPHMPYDEALVRSRMKSEGTTPVTKGWYS